MIEKIFEIKSNVLIAEQTFELVIEGDCSDVSAPGQFIDIKLEGFFLRRPISIALCDKENDMLTLVYKTVGKGTAKLALMGPGEKLDVLSPLGNGYDLEKIPRGAVLAGGGAGVPPMAGLALELQKAGKAPHVILGFNRKSEIFYINRFQAMGLDVEVATADGSFGYKGLITDLAEPESYICACGPEPMLKALYDKALDGQFSFEERMGCGIGICMGCSRVTAGGSKRICKDGPVLFKEEIIWQTQK